MKHDMVLISITDYMWSKDIWGLEFHTSFYVCYEMKDWSHFWNMWNMC